MTDVVILKAENRPVVTGAQNYRSSVDGRLVGCVSLIPLVALLWIVWSGVMGFINVWPSVRALSMVELLRLHGGGIVMMLFYGFFPLAMLVKLWRVHQKERRLEAAGRLLIGELVSFKGREDDDDYVIELSYRFRLPEGRMIEGKQREIANDLKGQQLPPGTRLAIWYSSPNHHTVL